MIDRVRIGATFLMIAICLTSCSGRRDRADKSAPAQSAPAGDAASADIADRNVDWPLLGNDAGEKRFSKLELITPENVSTLGVAWLADIDARSLRGVEATPIVVDGVMYVSGPWSVVMALDAKTGAKLWSFDPEVPGAAARKACCDVVNRGVAVSDGKVFVGTIDGRLVALDAKTGKTVWSVQTVDPSLNYTITGAPRVAAGNVIIGNSGAEYGVRGFVTAYDLATGKQKWRFYTVPGDPALGFENKAMEMAAKTWTGEWWKHGGGGTVWDAMAYDPELELFYIGVGNGAPWNVSIRSPQGGDNLFLSSIVALRPETGEYVWHYQTTPGEQWDYTATQHMILADIEIGGAMRKVIMQAPKNGFFYVLDRATGEFLSAKAYADVNWASGVDPETGRPDVVPEARYSQTGAPFFGKPSPAGAHGWQPMSFDPETGLVYFPVREVAYPFTAVAAKDFVEHERGWNTGEDPSKSSMPEDPAIRAQIRSSVSARLSAWDPVAQREVWSVPMKTPWNGGVLSTKSGLVFQGNGEGYFAAYDAKTGKNLWTSPFMSSGIVAAPMTYSIDGVQYVTVAVGWGGILPLNLGELLEGGARPAVNRIVTFKLGGSTDLPSVDHAMPPLNPPPLDASEADVNDGRVLFHTFCWMCHGDTAVNHGPTPDLRYSPMIGTAEGFSAFVLSGAGVERGMPEFTKELSPADAEKVRAYLIKRANDKVENPDTP